MLSLTVKVGQAVKLGDVGYIKVEDKYGRNVKLVFAMDIKPIKIIPTGIIPPEFTTGIIKRSEQPAA